MQIFRRLGRRPVMICHLCMAPTGSPMSDRSSYPSTSASPQRLHSDSDGGISTMIQSYHLEEHDYRGTRFADWPGDVKGNNDLLVITRPTSLAWD